MLPPPPLRPIAVVDENNIVMLYPVALLVRTRTVEDPLELPPVIPAICGNIVIDEVARKEISAVTTCVCLIFVEIARPTVGSSEKNVKRINSRARVADTNELQTEWPIN